jgi:predicted ATPase
VPTILRHLKLQGFRSIRETEIELKPVNVLIGANGAGKSNLVLYFHMLRACGQGALQEFISRNGGAAVLVHHGPKVTQTVNMDLEINAKSGVGKYHLQLEIAAEDRLSVRNESLSGLDLEGKFRGSVGGPMASEPHVRMFHFGDRDAHPSETQAQTFLTSIGCFHFQDTSLEGPLRRRVSLEDTYWLRSDGGNLPAFLWRLRGEAPDSFARITKTLQQLLPWFRELVLTPEGQNILLRCRVEGRADTPLGVSQLSDGTLRLIALITLFHQPRSRRPQMIVIDEPELGLHPAAEATIASLIRAAAAEGNQVLVATQSATFLSHFDPEHVIVAENEDGATTFERHTREELAGWLERYSLGQIWLKNLIGGRP